jgi:hypothetical protein
MYEGMRLTLFRSTKEPDLLGFSGDPAAQAYAEDSLSGGVASSDPVIKAVERDGFYLARSGVTITHSSEPGATR